MHDKITIKIVILLCILLFCAYISGHELKVLFALDILKKRFNKIYKKFFKEFQDL